MFVGVHERQLDPKGRVALPAPFRPRLEPRCYLTLGADKCVDVLTAQAFESVANDAIEKVRRGEMSRSQQRAIAANAVEVTIDAQGRINIDEKLREYAGLSLDSKVVISGSGPSVFSKLNESLELIEVSLCTISLFLKRCN